MKIQTRMIITFVAVAFVPLVLILPHLFSLGVDGVFLSEPISDLIGGGACFLTMYLTLYRKLGKSEERKAI